MIFSEQNFLSPSEFESLSDRVAFFYKFSKYEHSTKEEDDFYLNETHGRYTPGISEQSCKRVRFWTNSPDAQKESVGYFGKQIEPALNKLRQCLIDQGHTNIKLSNVWLQYGDPDTKMDRHSDGTIKGSDFTNSFTSMIFVHKHWESDWGGTFKLAPPIVSKESQIIETAEEFFPVPNSLVMWSRDHPHWMTPITHSEDLRMFLGMSWYE